METPPIHMGFIEDNHICNEIIIAEQIVSLPRQIEVAVANGKTTAQSRRRFAWAAQQFHSLMALQGARWPC